MNSYFKVIEQCFIFILINAIILLIHNPIICQVSEIKDCNDIDIPITSVIVSSSNNQSLNLANCSFSQGMLSDYLNCIITNNPSLPANANLIVSLTANPASGISGSDVVMLKDDILQKNIISNTCNRVGSDSDSNYKLNTIDLCLLLKHILGLSNIMPAWKFYNSQNLSITGIGSTTDLVFPVADFPLSSLNIIGVQNGNVNQSTIANDTCVLLCQPDLIIMPGLDEVRKLTPDYFLLNKSCLFPDLSLQILNDSGQIIGNDITQIMVGSQFTAQLEIANTSQSCITQFTLLPCDSIVNIDIDQLNTTDSSFVDVSVRNAEFIEGYQLSLKFDTSHLQFDKVEKGNESGFNANSDAHYNGNGHVNFSRFNQGSSLGLEEGTKLFRIKFKRKTSILSNVIIDPENVETLLFDANKIEYCKDITYLNDTNPPVCLQDTIILQIDNSVGYATVKFTDYASDDFGTVLFDSGFDEFDIPLTNIETFVCGTDLVTYILFKDANGQFKQCVFRVIVDCPIDSCSNKYLNFDGQDDRIVIPNQHNGDVEFTLECLFLSQNEIDNGTNSFHRLFTLGTSNRMEIGDQLSKLLYYDGNSISIGPNIRDSQWHHIAIVREASFVKVYLDGSIIMNRVDNSIDLNSLRVGFFDNNNLQPVTMWKGGIDEIKLWDHALSQQEIQASAFKANLNKKDCGLIGYWAFEDGVANANNSSIMEVLDSTETNNGVLLGFDLVGDTSNFVCNDSIEIVYDPTSCCQVAIFHSTQCNIINLNSAPFGFEDPAMISYQWTSPNTNFETTVPDTIWSYKGDLSDVIICLEATDGICTAITCDTIQVTQPSPPIIEGCADELSFSNYTSECGIIFEFTAPSAFDPCVDELIETLCTRSDGLAFDVAYPVGSTTITCIATSITGLTDTCLTNIIIGDEVPPVCIPITHQFYLDENGQDSIQLIDIPLPGFDECSEVFYSNSERFLKVDCFPSLGINVEIQDEYGNTTECIISFEVLDTFSPMCIVANQVVESIAGQDSVQVFYEYEVSDNCPNPSVSFSIPDSSKFACGSIQEIFMFVEDNFGNADTCSFTLVIEDCFNYIGSICGNVSEDLNCDGQISANEFPLEGIEIALLSPVDNDTLLIIQTDSIGIFKVDSLPPFTFKVRPIGIDGLYETSFPSSDEYIVTIDTFETIENLDFILFYDGPTTAISLEKVCYEPGDTVVLNWINNPCLTDANLLLFQSVCGNEMFSQIQNGIPNTGEYLFIIPEDASNQIMELAILGPGNTTFENYNCIEINDLDIDFNFELIGCKEFQFTATNNTYNTYEWTFGDGESDVTESSTSHDYVENDIYMVCLTVETTLGCRNTICKDVLVDGECDDCNVNFFVENIGCYEVGFQVKEDNYELSTGFQWVIDGVFETETREPFFDLGPGTFEVCLTVSDAICSDQFCRTITKDNIFPEFSNCPLEKIVYSLDENCSQIFHTNSIELGEFCHPGGANVPDIIYTRSDGQSLASAYDKGFTTITASFTDLYGVSSNCIYDIAVIDDTPPSCNINQNISLGLNSNGVAMLEAFMVDNGSEDNCGEVDFSINVTQFDCNNLGMQEVLFTATDGVNESSCISLVVIEDKINPSCNLDSFQVFLDEEGLAIISIDDLLITASDNCGVESTLFTDMAIDCSDIGENSISAQVFDSSGNSSICSTSAFVIDTIPPRCEVPNSNISLSEEGTATLDQSMIIDFVSDNCGIPTIELSQTAFNCDNLGLNDITIMLTDNASNVFECKMQINIEDKIKPTCEAKDIQVQATEVGGAFISFDYFAQDECSDVMISFSSPDNQLYECGEYDIIMTVEDSSGNTNTCDFKMVIKDCDGCCLSESAFMDLTNQGFQAEAMLQNGTNCIVQIFPPMLTDCQIITQLDWDDGTVTNGQFPSNLEFTHEYTDVGEYNICITMEETDSGECFSNQVCKEFEVTSECGIITNVANPEKEDVAIYPNPTTGYLTIQSSLEIDDLNLFDINGKRMKIIYQNKIVDISSLKPGIYLLNIRIGSQYIIKKIVKVN